MKLGVVFLSLFCIFKPIYGAPREVSNVQALEQYLNKSFKEIPASQTWVVFDIYHTLVHPKPPATHAKNMMEEYKDIFRKIFQTLTPNQAEQALNLSINHEKGLSLIDPGFPKLIKSLQEQKAIVSALTTSLAHSFGSIKNLQQWTYDYFQKNLDIDFNRSAPFPNEQKFVSSSKPHKPGLYYKGIFFTNGEIGLTKGEALVLMIKKSTQKPKIIIMVDDREKNLLSTQEELKKYDPSIQFKGFLFQGGFFASAPCGKKEFTDFWQAVALRAKS